MTAHPNDYNMTNVRMLMVKQPVDVSPPLYTYTYWSGDSVDFTKPEKRLSNAEVFRAFKHIKFNESKLRNVSDDELIFVYAMKVIHTKEGSILYAMDFFGNIYKTCERNADIFNYILTRMRIRGISYPTFTFVNEKCSKFDKLFTEYHNILITRGNPYAILHINKYNTHNEYPSTELYIQYTDSKMNKIGDDMRWIQDIYRKYIRLYLIKYKYVIKWRRRKSTAIQKYSQEVQ